MSANHRPAARGRHFAVVVTKDSGKRVVFGTYASLREAETQAQGLRALLPVIVDVIPVREGTAIAGMSMSARTRGAGAA